jgi:hypothetical protein
LRCDGASRTARLRWQVISSPWATKQAARKTSSAASTNTSRRPSPATSLCIWATNHRRQTRSNPNKNREKRTPRRRKRRIPLLSPSSRRSQRSKRNGLRAERLNRARSATRRKISSRPNGAQASCLCGQPASRQLSPIPGSARDSRADECDSHSRTSPCFIRQRPASRDNADNPRNPKTQSRHSRLCAQSLAPSDRRTKGNPDPLGDLGRGSEQGQQSSPSLHAAKKMKKSV